LIAANIALFMIFMAFDLSLLAICINCIFYIYMCCFITSFEQAILSFYT